MGNDNAAEKVEEGANQEALFVFEGHDVEKVFASLLGASGLALDETQIIEHGDEGEITLTFKCIDTRIKTKNRGRRDASSLQTNCTRVLKVDGVKSLRVKPKLVKS